MKTSQKGFVLPLLLIIVVAFIISGGVYKYQKSKQGGKIALLNTNGQSTSTVRTINDTPPKSITYDISDLGLKFTVSNTLSDLTYTVVHLSGDQAVNSVAFSSKRLESVGCDTKSAPLGYLTYDNDKGGILVGKARGSNLYFIKPSGQCGADASLQNWQLLQENLKSVISDNVPTAG